MLAAELPLITQQNSNFSWLHVSELPATWHKEKHTHPFRSIPKMLATLRYCKFAAAGGKSQSPSWHLCGSWFSSAARHFLTCSSDQPSGLAHTGRPLWLWIVLSFSLLKSGCKKVWACMILRKYMAVQISLRLTECVWTFLLHRGKTNIRRSCFVAVEVDKQWLPGTPTGLFGHPGNQGPRSWSLSQQAKAFQFQWLQHIIERAAWRFHRQSK